MIFSGYRLPMKARDHLKNSVHMLTMLLIFMWLLEAIDILLFQNSLDSFGIRPRTLSGLPGIALAPFLHAGFVHLASNTAPFFIFGLLCMAGGIGEFCTVVVSTALISGTGTWLTAPAGTVHIGASGIIFGMFGYLLLKGIFTRRFFPLLLSIAVATLYGGMIRGILPAHPGISWQSHFFGFAGGIVYARLTAHKVTGYTYSGRQV